VAKPASFQMNRFRANSYDINKQFEKFLKTLNLADRSQNEGMPSRWVE
jgi:hypothetical protein